MIYFQKNAPPTDSGITQPSTNSAPPAVSPVMPRASPSFRFTARRQAFSGAKRFRCGDCGVKFTRRYGLVQHQRRQHGMSGGFACPNCPQVFGQASHLRDHVDVHRAEQLYTCLCGKSFQRKSGLQKHARHCIKHTRNKWGSSMLWHLESSLPGNHASLYSAPCSFQQLPCVPGTSTCQAVVNNGNKLTL